MQEKPGEKAAEEDLKNKPKSEYKAEWVMERDKAIADTNKGRECILITGSSGLLGHALSHHFGSQGYQIVGLDQAGPPYPPPNTDCLFCDLTDDESVQKTFFMVRTLYGKKIKAVLHLAAYYSFSGKESNLYQELTVRGTERLLRELQNFDVGQFIFSSSMLLYKPNEKGEKLNEESEIAPTWEYPQSKQDTETLIKERRGHIPAVILRIAGVYNDVCQSIPVANQIQRIYEHKLEGHVYSGDVDVKQSFVHLDDVISAFELCTKNADKLPRYSVFNIGESDAMTYDDMQRMIARELFDEPWPTIEVPKPIAKVGAWVEDKLPLPEKPFIKPWMIDRADDNYELDISKAQRELGWTPQHSLRTTLPKMLEGLKLDPARWYKLNHLQGAEHADSHKIKPANEKNEERKTGGLLPNPNPENQTPLLPPPSAADNSENKVA
ncbi:MAG TPA: NAD(P)-dependent oxidoreductase [Oculatellaceae cyanobacterium]